MTDHYNIYNTPDGRQLKQLDSDGVWDLRIGRLRIGSDLQTEYSLPTTAPDSEGSWVLWNKDSEGVLRFIQFIDLVDSDVVVRKIAPVLLADSDVERFFISVAGRYAFDSDETETSVRKWAPFYVYDSDRVVHTINVNRIRYDDTDVRSLITTNTTNITNVQNQVNNLVIPDAYNDSELRVRVTALEAKIDSDNDTGWLGDSEWILRQIPTNLTDSDWILRQIPVDQVDSDWVLRQIPTIPDDQVDSDWVLRQIPVDHDPYDSDWILRQIPLDPIDSDWVLRQIPNDPLDSDWVLRQIYVDHDPVDSDWVLRQIYVDHDPADSDWILRQIPVDPIDSDWVLRQVVPGVAGPDSDWILRQVVSGTDSDWILRQIPVDPIDSDWVLRQIPSDPLDSDWVLRQIYVDNDPYDSDWILRQIPDNQVDSDWVDRQISLRRLELDSDEIARIAAEADDLGWRGDSDWILRQIPVDQVDSDWVLRQVIEDTRTDSDWILRQITFDSESAQDAVVSMLEAGTHNVTFTYVDADNSLSVTIDSEGVSDAVSRTYIDDLGFIRVFGGDGIDSEWVVANFLHMDSDRISLGSGANGASINAIAIGHDAQATHNQTVALGAQANASWESSIAIGYQAQADQYFSVAIGRGAEADSEYEIRLGDEFSGNPHFVTVHPNQAGQETRDNELVTKRYVDDIIPTFPDSEFVRDAVYNTAYDTNNYLLHWNTFIASDTAQNDSEVYIRIVDRYTGELIAGGDTGYRLGVGLDPASGVKFQNLFEEINSRPRDTFGIDSDLIVRTTFSQGIGLTEPAGIIDRGILTGIIEIELSDPRYTIELASSSDGTDYLNTNNRGIDWQNTFVGLRNYLTAVVNFLTTHSHNLDSDDVANAVTETYISDLGFIQYDPADSDWILRQIPTFPDSDYIRREDSDHLNSLAIRVENCEAELLHRKYVRTDTVEVPGTGNVEVRRYEVGRVAGIDPVLGDRLSNVTFTLTNPGETAQGPRTFAIAAVPGDDLATVRQRIVNVLNGVLGTPAFTGITAAAVGATDFTVTWDNIGPAELVMTVVSVSGGDNLSIAQESITVGNFNDTEDVDVFTDSEVLSTFGVADCEYVDDADSDSLQTLRFFREDSDTLQLHAGSNFRIDSEIVGEVAERRTIFLNRSTDEEAGVWDITIVTPDGTSTSVTAAAGAGQDHVAVGNNIVNAINTVTGVTATRTTVAARTSQIDIVWADVGTGANLTIAVNSGIDRGTLLTEDTTLRVAGNDGTRIFFETFDQNLIDEIDIVFDGPDQDVSGKKNFLDPICVTEVLYDNGSVREVGFSFTSGAAGTYTWMDIVDGSGYRAGNIEASFTSATSTTLIHDFNFVTNGVDTDIRGFAPNQVPPINPGDPPLATDRYQRTSINTAIVPLPAAAGRILLGHADGNLQASSQLAVNNVTISGKVTLYR